MLMCLVRGLLDRVARKAPLEADASIDAGNRKHKLRNFNFPYQACSAITKGILCVHPMSGVYTSEPSKVTAAVLMGLLLC